MSPFAPAKRRVPSRSDDRLFALGAPRALPLHFLEHDRGVLAIDAAIAEPGFMRIAREHS